MLKSHVYVYASILESRVEEKVEKLRTEKTRRPLQRPHAESALSAPQASKAGEVGQQAESAPGWRAFGTGSNVHLEGRIRKTKG